MFSHSNLMILMMSFCLWILWRWHRLAAKRKQQDRDLGGIICPKAHVRTHTNRLRLCIVCMCLMNKIPIASVLYQVSSVSHDIFSTYVPLHPLQTKTLDMFGVQDVSIKRFLLAWESKTGVFDSGCQNRLTSHELYASERRTPFPRSAFLFLALKSFWIFLDTADFCAFDIS